MVKNLRYFFVALLATMSFNTVAAQDVIWQEDWSDWSGYVKAVLDDANDNYTFTGTVVKEDGSFGSGTTIYNENLAGGEAPELLVAKNGGSFAAVVDLEGRSGDMTLTFKCNKNLTVTVEGGTVGENAGSGNDYVYPITGAAGTLTITIANTQSANARLDNIRLFQGKAKKPAGLSWGTSARTVTIGADDNLFPTLTNANNLPITYSSSETTVATIDTEGAITLVAAGQSVITAEFVGNDEYEAGKAQYTLTVKEAQQGGGDEPQPQTDAITVAKALEIIDALADGATTTETYQVKGYVISDPDFQRNNSGNLYGNVNFDMADEKGGTTTLTVFRAKGYDNKNFTEDDLTLFKKDDQVIFTGKLQKYVKNGATTPELTSGYLVQVISDDTRAEATIEFADGYLTHICPGPDGMFDVIGTSVALPTATVMANGAAVSGAAIEWSLEVKSWDEGKAQPVINGNKIVLEDSPWGEVLVKAEFAGNGAYKPATKSYTLTVHNGYGLLSEMAKDVNENNSEKYDQDGKPVFYFFRNIDAEGFPVVTNTVTFASGKYIYLTDGEANMLFYGDNTQGLKQGDVVSGNVSENSLGGFWGYLKRYNKLPELSFTEMNVKVESEGQVVEPKTITADKLADNINAYVKIENAEFVSIDNKNLTFSVDGATLAVYNQFGMNGEAFEAGATYTLTGMGAVYKRGDAEPVYQLYLTDFVKVSTGVDAIKADGVFSGKRYNMAGQVVTNSYKGLVIMNGKKFVQK